jgi:quercetin 2,3-dioxygenase
MAEVREVVLARASVPTLEGAGVSLRRAFSHGDVEAFDPFLMLDDFRGDDPARYQAGFPWHPHRGIETVTIMLEGEVEHGDSLGNAGVIRGGEVQWMTAGRGIVHQEMPRSGEGGRMGGFQLWVNLPRRDKMTAPLYRAIAAPEIPEVVRDGARLRVVTGELLGARGPVEGIAVEPVLLDVRLSPGAGIALPTPRAKTYAGYVFEGAVRCGVEAAPREDGTVLLFGEGDEIALSAGERGGRLLVFGGLPLREPVAWGGPIVMNTEAELRRAFAEYRDGTFLEPR